jgi:catechol 2,3-dioxygenase-like lactoylglutathione lyase family enzyme
VINGAHVILYSQDPDADRAFLQDVLGFPHVDAGHGWLIFKLPPAEVAVHPADAVPPVADTGPPAAGPASHELYLMCDDLAATLAELAARGVQAGEVIQQRWGALAAITLPSGAPLSLYQPRHPVAHSLGG